MDDKRKKIVGLGGAVGANALILAGLLTLHGGKGFAPEEDPGLVAIVTTSAPPPEPPPPDAVEEGASAEPSRGDTAEPSRSEPQRPLPTPQPKQPAPDAGAGTAAGAGAAEGSGAGTGGSGTGSGSGNGGNGSGSGVVTPPVRITGALRDSDYRQANPPKGARGTVLVAFTVDVAGSVSGCRVERSSGFAVLDQTTCRLVSQRFRFRPARDASGQPIAWTVRTDFTWVPR